MADNKIEIEVELNADQVEKNWNQLTRTIENDSKKTGKAAEDAAKKAGESVKKSSQDSSKSRSEQAKGASKDEQESFRCTEKQSRSSAAKVGGHWKQAADIARSALKTGLKVAGTAIVGTATALAGAGVAAIKTGISFESAFAGVKKTVNASKKELLEMRKGILDMSEEMPTSANEIAGVAEAAGQLGIKNDSILGFTKTMVQLGDSTNMSSDEAATSLARLANITRMPQKSFSNLGSTIVDLGNNLATTEQEITDMALRLAGAGHQVGMSEADILSFAGALSSVGIEAEAGGTAFSTLMSKMNLAATKGGDELNDFAKVSGMTADQFKKSFEKDAAGAIISFIQGLDNINKNGGSAIKTLDDMGLSDIRMRDALLRAAGASGTFTEALQIGNNAWEENTALQNEANQRYETTESKISMLGNKFKRLGISIYDDVNNPIRGAVDVVTGYVDQLKDSFEKDGFDGLAKEAGTVFANLATDVAKQAPNLIRTASKVVKSFVSGIVKNGPQIRNAAKSLVKELAGGIGDLLPEQMGTSLKNLSNILIQVADKGFTVLSKALGIVAHNFSIFLPLVTSAYAAVKGYTVVRAAASAIKQMSAAWKISSIALAEYSAIQSISSSATILFGTTLKAHEILIGVLTGKIQIATAAQLIWNAACAALGGPIGVAIVAVGTLAAGLAAFAIATEKGVTKEEKLIQQHEKSVASYKKLSKELADNKRSREDAITSAESEGATAEILSRKLDGLMKQEHKSAGTKEQIKTIVQQLNQILPDLGLAYDDEKDKLNQSTKAIQRNIKTQRELAVAKAYAAQNEKVAEDIIKTEKDLTKYKKEQKQAEDDLAEATRKRKETERKFKEDPFHTSGTDVKIAEREEKKLKKINDEKLKLVGDTQKKINELNNEIDSNIAKSTALTNYVEFTNNIDKLAKEAGIKASEIPKSVGEGIKAGIYTNPASGKDLLQLIDIDKLLSKAGEAGLKIPAYLSQGMADGSISFKTAAQKLENGINWTGMIEKARAKGIEVPNSIAEGIQSGQYAVPTSVDAVANLVTFEDLQVKARNGGVQVPESLASGITSGSMKPKEAAAALGNLMDFQEAINKAGLQGAQIPTELATKVAEGKTSVDDAIKQLIVNTPNVSPDEVGFLKSFDTIAGSVDTKVKEIEDSGKRIQKVSSIPVVDNKASADKTFGDHSKAAASAEKKVKKSTDGIKKSSVIPAADSSANATKNVNGYVSSIGKGAGKAKTEAKKVSNSAVSGFSGGTSKAKSAGSKLGSAYVSGISSKNGQATAKGKELSSKTASGVTANKGKIKTAAQGAVNGAKKVSTSGFNSVGKNISSGIASGINENSGVVSSAARKVIQQAKDAANAEADSHSPSRVFRDEVGKFLPLGAAVGIRKNTGEVVKASVAMTQASLNAVRKDLGIHSPSTVFNKAIGKYIPLGMAAGIEDNAGKVTEAAMKVINVTIGAAKKSIASPSKMFKELAGKNIPKGIAKGIREGQSELVAEMESVINTALSAAKKATTKGNYSDIGSDLLSGLNNSLSTAKQRSSETVQEIIDQAYNKQVKASEKAENKLQKKIDKLGNKKKNKKQKAKLKQELKDLKAANAKKEKQLKEAGEKAANAYNTAFEKEADRLTKIAEEKIQALSEKYQEQYNEIKSLQDGLISKQQSYGSMYDLDQNLHDIEDYQARLKALENKIPDSLMQRILGMDVEEGRQYMAWFQSLTAAEQKAYTDKWNKQQDMSKSFSESFFKDDFEQINKEYQTELDKAVKELEKQMKEAGKNIAKGLTAGIKGETRNLSKAMKKLCKDIVKAAKNELKIKSPSRVFAQIGKFTIQGAEKGQEKEAPKLYRQVETVADTMAARFAKANLNIPDLQGGLQTAVSRQMSKITASVQPQVVYAGGGGTTTIEKTVYTGPEKIEVVTNIEGREAARTLAPFMDSRLNSMADRKARGGV